MRAIRQKITERKLITVPCDAWKAALQRILTNNRKNIRQTVISHVCWITGEPRESTILYTQLMSM